MFAEVFAPDGGFLFRDEKRLTFALSVNDLAVVLSQLSKWKLFRFFERHTEVSAKKIQNVRLKRERDWLSRVVRGRQVVGRFSNQATNFYDGATYTLVRRSSRETPEEP